MKYVYHTDKGKIRQVNEDAVAVFNKSEDYLLAVVADGMGGHQAGDVASKLTIENLHQYWLEFTGPFDRPHIEKWLSETIRKINNIVYERARSDKACYGMGTTIVTAFCTEEFIVIAHIGDSRAYFLNEEEIKQVTKDHSLVAELVRTGQLSEEDALYHPKKNVILKALGTEKDVEPDIYYSTWDNVNHILVCSDGLTNKISDKKIHEMMQTYPLKEIGPTLIDEANASGGEDNITLAIIARQAEVGETPC